MVNREDLLELCLEALEAGVPLDDLLARLPDEAEDLKSLLTLASAMRALPQPASVKIAPTWQSAIKSFSNGRLPEKQLRQRSRFRGFNWPRPLASGLAMLAAVLALAWAAIFIGQPATAQVAIITELTGHVEVASEEGGQTWRVPAAGEAIRAGQRLRTGEASAAMLTFADGSFTRLYANSDLTLSTLSGSANGASTVRLVQHTGRTSHEVTPRGPDAVFVVETAAGVALAQGTTFNVFVNPRGQTRFAVDAGQVRVEAQGKAVVLSAGQASIALPGHTPGLPANEFQEQGIITGLQGPVWVIGGVPIRVSNETAINGQPAIGVVVNVEGRILANGVWLADIVDVVSARQTTASFTGRVEAVGRDQWRVGGLNVRVTDQTAYDVTLRPGAMVRVTFQVLEGGQRRALRIQALDGDWPTSTAKRPSLTLEPDEVLVSGCGSQFAIAGRLFNDGESPNDDVSRARLDQRVIRGAAFMEMIRIDPAVWEAIAAGAAVNFNVSITLNEKWTSAVEGEEVKVQVYVAEVTDLPGQSPARLTITVVRRCLPPPTATTGGTPQATPTSRSATPGPDDNPTCLGSGINVIAGALAEQFDVSYAEITAWFCAGFGFGEIRLAYEISAQTGITVEEIFALRQTGLGWGEIMIQLGVLPGVIPSQAAPTEGVPSKAPTGPPPGIPTGPPPGVPPTGGPPRP